MTSSEPQSQVAESKPVKSTRAPLIVSIIIVAVAAACAGLTVDVLPAPPPGAPDTLETAMQQGQAQGFVQGQLIGASLMYPGLVWLVLYFGFVRRSGRKVGFKYFAILVGVALVVSYACAFLAGAL